MIGSLLLGALLAGCGADDPPMVTFATDATVVQARPTQYCDLKLRDCASDAKAPVRLLVPPGASLRVQVPDTVATTPWVVVFSYRDATGAQSDARSKVFAPNERRDYTLELPAPTDQLVTAQVQQYGPPPEAAPNGELQFPVRSSWVLNVG